MISAHPDYPRLEFYLAGKWSSGEGRASEPVICPATGESLGELPHAAPADLRIALDAARQADETWRHTPAVQRSALLRRAADIIREESETLAGLIALELGKPIVEARKETTTAAEMFEWAAEEGRRAYGRVIPSRSEQTQLLALREPLGPVAAFAGWNAPSITPARKIAGALAAGCPVIIKPAEASPATALFLARALDRAGVPEGVLSMVFGDPATIARTLLSAPEIRMVTFTGSVPVGKDLAAQAAATMKRTVFELGGHAPVLVFPDVDVEAVARAGARTKFRNSGQICTSPTRFLVHREVHDRFVDAFTAEAARIRVGDPLDESTEMGPLQNPRRLDAIRELVEDAVAAGAELRSGGDRPSGLSDKGWYFEPTVLTRVTKDCRAANEEPFGPLALVSAFDTTEEALAEANRLPLGLASYVFSNDLRVVDHVVPRIRAGSVIVNRWVVSLPETPFGGVLDSGIGTEGGVEGLQAFQQVKFVSRSAG
ncbi:NAD-dependent succinate-semialdehyde dehydrogenase [Streptomyces sp. NPDC005349]|uniref:NAD-dependent succinate-semialdehyde dehydrogenase n=1 Tax=Streptomyces sp. NPDC005349 TaxID=3157037 RepID=UPI0033BBB2D5